MVPREISSDTTWLWAGCVLLSLSGCRYGYERIDLGEAGGADGITAGAGSGGGSTSSDGGPLEGGAPGDAGNTTSSAGSGGTAAGTEVGGAASTGTAGTGGGTSSSGGTGGAASDNGGSGGSGASGGAVTAMGGSGGTGAGTPPDMSLCVEDTYGGHDYLLCEERRTWPEAVAGCLAVGMRLVRIDDLAENEWLYDNRNVPQVGAPPDVWIGASDLDVEGEWRWTDGELFWTGDDTGMANNGLFANWYGPEPTL